MNPTYSELVNLNPNLSKKTKEEVDALVETINSCGYEWDYRTRQFFNKEINKSVKTLGLDLFDPKSFLKSYETWSNEELMEAGDKVGNSFKLFFKTIFFVIFSSIVGFIFFSWKVGVSIFVISVIVLTIIYFKASHYTSKQDKLREKNSIK